MPRKWGRCRDPRVRIQSQISLHGEEVGLLLGMEREAFASGLQALKAQMVRGRRSFDTLLMEIEGGEKGNGGR